MSENIEVPVKTVKWYWKRGFVIFALLSIGPFALPLVWWNPHMTSTQKWMWSVIVLVITYFTVTFVAASLDKTFSQLKELGLIQ